jgi:hypothetical protein
MANVYIVSSLAVSGPTVIVTGTVNGVSVATAYPSSMTFANVALFQAYIGPLMLAAAPQPTQAAFQGTWTV